VRACGLQPRQGVHFCAQCHSGSVSGWRRRTYGACAGLTVLDDGVGGLASGGGEGLTVLDDGSSDIDRVILGAGMASVDSCEGVGQRGRKGVTVEREGARGKSPLRDLGTL
jgi:hypothetical protein